MNKRRFKAAKMADRYLKNCEKSRLKLEGSEGTEEQAGGGTVTGYAATFDREPDSYGDVIAPGAFTESLKRWAALNEQGKYIPLLYGHNAFDPDYNIGRIVSAKEDERGLLVTAEFDPDNPKAQYVRKLVQEGRVYQFSFAFDVLSAGETELDEEHKANELRKLEIYEISLVQIPANQHATVEDVKSRTTKAGRRNSKSDEDQLATIRDHAAAIQEIVNNLITDTDSSDDDSTATDDASTEEPGAEDQEAKAVFLKKYKEAVRAALID